MAIKTEDNEMDEMILTAVLMRLIEVNPDLTEDELRAEGERIYAEMQAGGADAR